MNSKFIILFLLLPTLLSEQIIIEKLTPTLLNSYEQNRQEIFKLIKQYSTSYGKGYPNGYEKYIKNLIAIPELKIIKTSLSHINSLQRSYNLHPEVSKQLSKLKYSKTTAYDIINFHLLKNEGILENVFGIAKRFENNEIFFAYIKGKSAGDLIPQYKEISVRRCRRILFVTRCGNYGEKVLRGFEANELDTIKRTLESKFYNSLDEAMEMGKNNIYKIFREYTDKLRYSLPSGFFPVFDKNSLKGNIEFQTHEINYNDLTILKSKFKLSDIVIQQFQKIQNNIGKHIDFYHVFSQNIYQIHMAYGVALRTKNTIIFSMIIGRAEVKLNEAKCQQYKPKKQNTPNPQPRPPKPPQIPKPKKPINTYRYSNKGQYLKLRLRKLMSCEEAIRDPEFVRTHTMFKHERIIDTSNKALRKIIFDLLKQRLKGLEF